MDQQAVKKWYYYISSLKRRADKISAHRISQFEEKARIVRRMYEVIGHQDESTNVEDGQLEESLQEIARHVSSQEGREFTVSELRRIYKSVTSGDLNKQVAYAKEAPLERIWREAAIERRKNQPPQEDDNTDSED